MQKASATPALTAPGLTLGHFCGDLVVFTAVIKVLFLRSLPAAKIIDAEQFNIGELAGVFGQDGFIARAQIVLRGNFLCFRAPQPAQIFFGGFARAFFLSTTLSTTATGGSASIETVG